MTQFYRLVVIRAGWLKTDSLKRSGSRLGVGSVGTTVTCHHHTGRHCLQGILREKICVRTCENTTTANSKSLPSIFYLLGTIPKFPRTLKRTQFPGGVPRPHLSPPARERLRQTVSWVVQHFTERKIGNLLCSFK